MSTEAVTRLSSARFSAAGAVALALVVFAAAVAGVGVAANPLVIVVLALGVVVVLSAAFPESWWKFVPLSVLALTPQILAPDPDVPLPNGDAAQKAVLIVGLVALTLAAGLRRSGIGAAALGVLGLAAAASLLNVNGQILVAPTGVLRALVGFVVPWLFLFIDWRRISRRQGLLFLSLLPLMSLLLGLILLIAGVSAPVRREWGGALRLQGAAVPAHLAMLALVGLVAAVLVVIERRGDVGDSRWVLLLPGLNFAVVLGTVTRGAIAVGVAVAAIFVVTTIARRTAEHVAARNSAWLLLAAALTGTVLAAGQIMTRNQGNAYEGAFNTSGREQAWDFFLSAGAASPLTGRGLGFSSVAVEQLRPAEVQEAFIAPHNEYIHMFVDGGLFLAIGILACFAAVFVRAACACRGPSRGVIAVLGAGTFFYSAVDNTLSAPQFSVTVLILLGILIAHPATGRSSIRPLSSARYSTSDSFG